MTLLENGYDVVIVDNLYNSFENVIDRIEKLCGRRPAFHNVDVTDEKALDGVFDKHPEIDSVIHFGALKVCTNFSDERRPRHKLMIIQTGRW